MHSSRLKGGQAGTQSGLLEGQNLVEDEGLIGREGFA
jgi:hypothetical protein